MSEEDFLYEAYGKDLLKQEGIDFESKLYWYQRMKNTNDPTRFEDPRDNAVFMEDLIKNARALFQQESWYREASTTNIMEMSKYVTGEVLDSATVVELFPEFFENVSSRSISNSSLVFSTVVIYLSSFICRTILLASTKWCLTGIFHLSAICQLATITQQRSITSQHSRRNYQNTE